MAERVYQIRFFSKILNFSERGTSVKMTEGYEHIINSKSNEIMKQNLTFYSKRDKSQNGGESYAN